MCGYNERNFICQLVLKIGKLEKQDDWDVYRMVWSFIVLGSKRSAGNSTIKLKSLLIITVIYYFTNDSSRLHTQKVSLPVC